MVENSTQMGMNVTLTIYALLVIISNEALHFLHTPTSLTLKCSGRFVVPMEIRLYSPRFLQEW